MKDRDFFALVGVIAGAILGWLPLPLVLKLGTYVGLAVVLTCFTFLMQWFDRKLELKKGDKQTLRCLSFLEESTFMR